VTKALDGGQTPNEEEEKQIDAIDAEIATIQKNIDRVQDMIKQAEQAAKTATPAAGENHQQAKNSAEGNPNPAAPATVIETLPKGIGFAQFVRAKMLSAHEVKKGNTVSAVQAAKSLGYGENVVQFIEKATLHHNRCRLRCAIG
jgi:cell division septum initiation protein DivIVA